MRILLAEDDFVTRKFMSNFLSKYGICDAAADGLEAFRAYKMALEEKQPYDVICLDIYMPQMDGYEVLANIRNLEKERHMPEEQMAKIIMTTASSDEKSIATAFELGCTSYSGKPIDKDHFEEALKQWGLF